MKRKKSPLLMLIDGHGLSFRAFYALERQNLRNPVTNEPTQAIHGFFRMLIKLLKDIQPTYLVIAWDTPETTFRKKMYADYKAKRKEAPPELIAQLAKIQEFVVGCGLCSVKAPGYEADDIIATFTSKYSKDVETLIVSSDKDCWQLISDRVQMMRPLKGVSQFVMIDRDWLKKEIGISVEQVCDYLALMGDQADNIPGVKGVGEKTAVQLLAQQPSLEKIYEHVMEISSPSLQKKLITKKEMAFISKKLVTMKKDIHSTSLSIEGGAKGKSALEQMQLPKQISDAGIQRLQDYSLSQIAKQLQAWQQGTTEQSGKNKTGNREAERIKLHRETLQKTKQYQLISTLEELREVLNSDSQTSNERYWSIDTETTGINPVTADLVGISFCYRANQAWYLPLCSPRLAEKMRKDPDNILEHFSVHYTSAQKILNEEFFADSKLRLIGQNIRYDLEIFYQHGFSIPTSAIAFDTMIASYLCRPHIRRHNLTDMTRDLLKQDKLEYKDLEFGKDFKNLITTLPSAVAQYACEDADVTFQLYELLKKQLKQKGMLNLFTKIEMPLLSILLRMQLIGVKIDRNYLHELAQQYQKQLKEHATMIYKLAGSEFNINSVNELQHVLFSVLKLPKPQKKTKSGFSTDQKVLEQLVDIDPIIAKVLEYRKTSKLLSTYVENLIQQADQQDRVHTTYSQTIATTGRLSSFHPNLQNIPRNETAGRSIRRAFIVTNKQQIFLAADYSQIELRIMAHFSQDKNLLQCYQDGNIDIHRKTAAAIFDVPEKQINSQQRNVAKIVNFSIVYGATEYGLARSLNQKNTREAKQMIDRFFSVYPGIHKYMERTLKQARDLGYVATLLGRVRPTPELQEGRQSNYMLRRAAERVAINAPIQGTSADIIKIAMINIQNRLETGGYQTKMLLQVHDELLFEVHRQECSEVLEFIKKEMEQAYALSVPLVVNYGWGKSWDEAQAGNNKAPQW